MSENPRYFLSREFFVVVLFVMMLFVPGISADVRLPAIIGDDMVLQQGKRVPIWGWAEPGETVTVGVSWHSMKWGVTAGDDGKWKFDMKAPEVGGPYEMTFSAGNTVTVKNILVGEVWVCSGQSNMQWPVQRSADAEQEIAAADYPKIRLFSVTRTVADEPQEDCVAKWTSCSPQTVPEFSAVGYFFGRRLYKELDVPIGLIHTSWGGTPAEAWTSAETLGELDDYEDIIERMTEYEQDPEPFDREYEERMAEWRAEITLAGESGKRCIEADFNDSGWNQMYVPKLWEQEGLADFDGLVWLRKEVEVPESWLGKDLVLQLGPIDDMDTTWFNGTKVGAHERSGQYQANRRYRVPGDLVQAGRNVIVVKVMDTGGGGGIYGNRDKLWLKPAMSDDSIALAGQWKYKKGFDLASVPAQPKGPPRIDNPRAPTSLYNGMIAPLLPYGIAGAIWYQGEANANRAYQYRTLFPAMIKDWRKNWGQGTFPFLFVQLANFMAVNNEPMESAWAELREAQLMTLNLPETGMAVIIDIGEADDIHPKNKQDVGKRLALWALAKTYEQDIAYSGPLYRSMVVEDGKAIIHFDHAGDGLVARGGERLKGFSIAGEDREFVWADAKIEGGTVVVQSDQVNEPVAVRYAWANNPVCNLYNEAGLPASPFRTDDWPGATIGNR